MKHLRNFCIIAHIDHGKSTLADRLLEMTGTITQRDLKTNQILDDMALEQERGITIKLHAVQMEYDHDDGETYTLNLIDTPGHVDFSYEVSRSLNACEGAILVVDATQSVEAQTISNLYLAIDANLEIIPVINKVDLDSAMVDQVSQSIIDLIGCKKEDIIPVSAKSGINIDQVLKAVVERVPAPVGDPEAPLQSLIFDSVYDAYRGAVVYMRVVEGIIKKGDHIKFFANDKRFEVEEVGILHLTRQKCDSLRAGDVGYMIPGAKDVSDTNVGDTITHVKNAAPNPLPGYKLVKPMVFSGLYPTDSDDFEDLREALSKLKMNDSAISYSPESSAALGFGFRCGFLGLLHMEIVQERLEREFDLSIINTVPNVEYVAILKETGKELVVDNPSQLPDLAKIDHIREPYIKAQIITPTEYLGNIMKLCMDRRGEYINTTYLEPTRVDLEFELPLSEIIFDFYDKLKSVSRGYASFDYDLDEYRQSDLVKLDVLLNNEPVDALSSIVHRSKAYDWGRRLCRKLKNLIPRQMFEVVIQAAIGNKVIARDVIRAMRKNVTAKCYGGDISRKRKLLEKQKEGKKRMKTVGLVEVPQEAFLAVLSMDD
jgi:GTP-binding protein LepA